MTYTISTMPTKIANSTGYSFIDQYGHCFIIVYGKTKRDLLIKKLKI